MAAGSGGVEQVDAASLKDDARVRRTDLARRHTEALASGDPKAVAEVEKEIKAEYADDDKAADKG